MNFIKRNILSMLLLLFLMNTTAHSTTSFVVNCPESISGFTLLGEYNDHKYYLSNSTSTWEEASVFAAANGGYLASFESAEENEFVRSQLGGVIAFIGYNDVATEGNFQWDSGESVGYTNVSGNNDASKDYAHMNFWNGSWSFDGPFTARPYVLEIACGAGPTCDLTCEFISAPGNDWIFQVNNGSQPYTFSLDNIDDSDPPLVDVTSNTLLSYSLDPGSYVGTVTDADGCVCTQSLVVEDNSGGDCNVQWTTTANNITITGLDAPHSIMKLFSPNWSIVYDCFDDCPDPLLISGLTNGATYHLSYNLFDENWQEICEDVVDVVITGNTNNVPNLFTNNLNVPSTVEEGSIMNFTFNLNNNGTTTANGSYVINIYANSGGNSTLVGEVPTGNTPLGTIADVVGAANLSGLPPGDYSLLIRTDDGNQIVELNENDNDTSVPFTIESSEPTDGCGFLSIDLASADYRPGGDCTAQELSNKYRLSCIGGSTTGADPVMLNLEVDKNGDFLNFGSSPVPETDPQDFLSVVMNADQDIEVSLVAGGTTDAIWTQTVTLDPGANYEVTNMVIGRGVIVYDGFFVAGTIVVEDPNVGANVFLQYTIKLNENTTVEYAKVLGEDVIGGDFFFSISNSYTTSGGYIFDVFQSNLLSFIKFSEEGDFLWKTSHASDLPSNSLRETEISADEQFIYAVNRNNQRAYIDKINTNTGVKVYNLQVSDELGGDFGQNIEGIYLTPDGGLITGISSSDFTVGGEVFNFGKLDASGNAVWTNQISGDFSFEPLLQTSDGGFLWTSTGNVFNEVNLSVLKITEDGSLTPACDEDGGNGTEIGCDLSYTTSGGNLTLTGDGLDAAHVIIKIFTPNWETEFSCFDDCGSSIDLSGLSEGTYRIKVDLYNSSWEKTCSIQEDIPVGATNPLEGQTSDVLFFNAMKDGRAANLNWVSNTSYKTDYFVLERSVDGQSFEMLRQLPALDDSDQERVYQSNDVSPMIGTNFYRLTQVFKDGSIRESMIRPLTFEIDLDAVTVFPNPTANEFFLSLKPYTGATATVSIVDGLGVVVDRIQLDEILETPIRFDASDLRSGVYHVAIQVGAEKMITKRIVIAKK